MAQGADAQDAAAASAAGAARELAGRLRRRIISGDLQPGTRLPAEPELQRVFGVSRATLRSAFRVLESEGLVRILRGARGGAEVTHPSANTAARYFGLLLQSRDAGLADFVTARCVLEPPMAALLAKNADSAAIARLRTAIAQESEVAALGDAQSYVRATVDFHSLVAELSGSRTLWVAMDLLDGVLQRYAEERLRLGPHTPGLRNGHRAHAKLVELVEQGDATGARELWERHAQELGAALMRSSIRGHGAALFA